MVSVKNEQSANRERRKGQNFFPKPLEGVRKNPYRTRGGELAERLRSGLQIRRQALENTRFSPEKQARQSANEARMSESGFRDPQNAKGRSIAAPASYIGGCKSQYTDKALNANPSTRRTLAQCLNRASMPPL